MNSGKLSTTAIVEEYKPDVIRLSSYLPWLESKCGRQVTSYYDGNGSMQKTVSFPVYDSMFLSMLNDASTTIFMDNNYRYVYTRNSIRNYEDEWKAIEKADIRNMDILGGILSRYVLGGLTKAVIWKEGMEYQIFLRVIAKAKEIIEHWDVPIEVQSVGMENEFMEEDYRELSGSEVTDLLEEEITDGLDVMSGE